MLKLRGILCPIATPFNHRGELRATKVRHNIGRLQLTTLGGLIVGSTWGEGPLLGEADLLELWNEAKAAAVGDKLLIAAAGAESVRESITRCRAANEAGFDAVWIAPHRTFAGDSRLQLLHFRSIADSSPLPVVVGEINQSTLSASEAALLGAHPNVAAICSQDEPLVHLAGLLDSDDCAPLTSQVLGLADALAGGVRAAVLPLANVLPFHLLSIEEAVRTREVAAANDLERRLQAIDAALTRYGVPGLKHSMDLRGYYGGVARLPLQAIDAAAQDEIAIALDGLAS
jgi:dihydrodipicolinate synthase/N-acetylneuraminate lyase